MKKKPDTNYMMLDSIYKKTVVTKYISLVAWSQKLGRVLQKDIKKCFELIVVVVTSVYIITKLTKLYTKNGCMLSKPYLNKFGGEMRLEKHLNLLV